MLNYKYFIFKNHILKLLIQELIQKYRNQKITYFHLLVLKIIYFVISYFKLTLMLFIKFPVFLFYLDLEYQQLYLNIYLQLYNFLLSIRIFIVQFIKINDLILYANYCQYYYFKYQISYCFHCVCHYKNCHDYYQITFLI